MTSQARKTIAIDIDDVVAMTTEAVRVWANRKTGVTLQPENYFFTDGGYWNYYEEVWERHGITNLHFGEFLDSMDHSQAHISVVNDAQRIIEQLKNTYDIVFITARRPVHKDSTRRWIDEYIDASISLYLSQNPFANEAAQSKGEICAELGVDILIDDNIDNCQSAVQYGVEVILFGNYGWNANAPETCHVVFHGTMSRAIWMVASSEFRSRVELFMAQVPAGQVTTYGDLAALAGHPYAARIVGGIAHYGNPELPWHRLVNRFGELAAGYHGGRQAQREHLEAEGITCTNDIVNNFEEIRWRPL